MVSKAKVFHFINIFSASNMYFYICKNVKKYKNINQSWKSSKMAQLQLMDNDFWARTLIYNVRIFNLIIKNLFL
jgi:hypothetical protein